MRIEISKATLKSEAFNQDRLYNSAMKKINNILLATLLCLSSAAQALTLEGRVVGVAMVTPSPC